MEANFGNRTVALKALVGSHNYNLNTPTSDKDWKFFVFPTFEDLYNGNRFSNGKQSAELDYTVHDIRSLGELLWKANINFIEVLFSQEHTGNDGFNNFFWYKEEIASMNLPGFFNATYGMHLNKMKGLHKGTATTLPLVEKFGYDTKEATHAMRCLLTLSRYRAIESMEQALWYEEGSNDRNLLLHIKAGKYTEEQFVEMIEAWKSTYKENLERWYFAQKPNLELKNEMELVIKSVIKWRLKRDLNTGIE